MNYLKAALATALIVGSLVGLAHLQAADSASTGYSLVGEDLERFRSDFNAAKDHVRAVLLVGPT
jgi:argininosuccinate synthase